MNVHQENTVSATPNIFVIVHGPKYHAGQQDSDSLSGLPV
jgi:hypothetical protein